VPGIAGIIFKPGSKNYRAEHAAMMDAMHHEPFYVSGVHFEDTLNLRLGWVLHANSYCDGMPVFNQRRDIAMVFHGENFPQNSSSRRGGFRTVQDLLTRYEETGRSFLLELNGWFSGVIVDLRQRNVLLFNDRYGMQRLYCHESQDAFFFASEAKSLLRSIPSTRELNTDALAEYVAFDCVLEDKSLFKGISLLPDGSSWTFDDLGRLRKDRYYSPEMLESSKGAKNEQDLVDRLERLFTDKLPDYYEASQKVAVSLTGGLDTRLAVAGAGSGSIGLPAYTFAGPKDTFDVRRSREVARAAGLKHRVIRLESDFFREFPKLAQDTIRISDGTQGIGGTHNLYLNRIARTIAPVRLTGQFGSEVLRQGRILSNAVSVSGLMDPGLNPHINQAEQRGASYRKGNPLTAALHRDIPWRGQGTMSIEQSQIILRSPFMDNDLVELLYRFPNSVRETTKVQMELIQRLNPRLGSIVSDRGYASGRNALGLSAIQLYLWVLFKADYVYFFDMPNWLLRIESAMEFTQVPKLLFGFHKFENYRLWYRRALSEYVADTLLDARTLGRSFFDKKFLQKAVNDHIAGRGNYRIHLDKALTFELIMRTLVEPTEFSRQTQSGAVAAATL
jgi:asparagine synthase (glutamine-hydrolysing)